MVSASSRGICQFCEGAFSKAAMNKHLETCAQRSAAMTASSEKAVANKKILHLFVEGRDNSQYWMHLEMPATSALKTLDSFLRRTWLECCGHLSQFEIAGVSYVSFPDRDTGDKSMDVKVGNVLNPGVQFAHEYDFGSTTELKLRVLSERQGAQPGQAPVKILARNEPPAIACDECGKPATEICGQCVYDDKGWLCNKCAAEHECGEDMLLPVVNSPRVGVCGYTG